MELKLLVLVSSSSSSSSHRNFSPPIYCDSDAKKINEKKQPTHDKQRFAFTVRLF